MSFTYTHTEEELIIIVTDHFQLRICTLIKESNRNEETLF